MKILAVDDDQIVLGLLEKVLGNAGYEKVRTCESADEALELIKNARQPYDCFLLDIQMSGMDGLQLCQKIRETKKYAETPILMLTAMSDKSNIDRAFAAGASDYLTKPLDATEITARLGIAENLIKERKSLEESAGVIDSLIEMLDRTTAHDFDDAIDLGKMDRLLRYPAFENYVYQSGRGAMFLSTVFAAKIRGAEDLHRKLPPLEFKDFLRTAAKSIIRRLQDDDVHIAYRGAGEFSGYVPRRNTQMFESLSSEMEIQIAESEGKYAEKLPKSTHVVFAPGAGMRLPTRGELSRSIWTAVENVRAKVETGTKQNVHGWFSRKSPAKSDDERVTAPDAQRKLQVEFAQMLRDEVKSGSASFKKPSARVFGAPAAEKRKRDDAVTANTSEAPRQRVIDHDARPAVQVGDILPPEKDTEAPPRRRPMPPAQSDSLQGDSGLQPVQLDASAQGHTSAESATKPDTATSQQPSVEQALEAALNRSRRQFVDKLVEYRPKLEKVAKSDARSEHIDAAIEDAVFIAHRIAGVGKTLGFAELGAVARRTEAALVAYRQERDSPKLREVSVARADHLARAVQVTCDTYGKPTT